MCILVRFASLIMHMRILFRNYKQKFHRSSKVYTSISNDYTLELFEEMLSSLPLTHQNQFQSISTSFQQRPYDSKSLLGKSYVTLWEKGSITKLSVSALYTRVDYNQRFCSITPSSDQYGTPKGVVQAHEPGNRLGQSFVGGS